MRVEREVDNRQTLIAALAALVLGGACAGSAAVTKNLHDREHPGIPFRNVLVIGVADDYNGRAAFEREMVAFIRNLGGDAKAYYRIAGDQPQLSAESVRDAARQGGFDAVLVTRVAGQDFSAEVKRGTAETKATTVGGNVINLFRYDYTELNEPERVDFSGAVTLTTDLYAVMDESVVWSIDTHSSGHAEIGELIEAQGQAIAAQLRRDRIVGR